MKKILMVTVLGLFLGVNLVAGGGELWLTDFKKAKKEAAEKKVPILVDFSGSDWCGWCVKLDKEVFSKPEFKKYAKENLVLLMIDFPRNKKQSKQLKKQNRKLANKFGVRGFPTVLVLDENGNIIQDKDGQKIGKTGYRDGGPKPYVKHLKEMIAKAVKPRKSKSKSK